MCLRYCQIFTLEQKIHPYKTQRHGYEQVITILQNNSGEKQVKLPNVNAVSLFHITLATGCDYCSHLKNLALHLRRPQPAQGCVCICGQYLPWDLIIFRLLPSVALAPEKRLLH